MNPKIVRTIPGRDCIQILADFGLLRVSNNDTKLGITKSYRAFEQTAINQSGPVEVALPESFLKTDRAQVVFRELNPISLPNAQWALEGVPSRDQIEYRSRNVSCANGEEVYFRSVWRPDFPIKFPDSGGGWRVERIAASQSHQDHRGSQILLNQITCPKQGHGLEELALLPPRPTIPLDPPYNTLCGVWLERDSADRAWLSERVYALLLRSLHLEKLDACCNAICGVPSTSLPVPWKEWLNRAAAVLVPASYFPCSPHPGGIDLIWRMKMEPKAADAQHLLNMVGDGPQKFVDEVEKYIRGKAIAEERFNALKIYGSIYPEYAALIACELGREIAIGEKARRYAWQNQDELDHAQIRSLAIQLREDALLGTDARRWLRRDVRPISRVDLRRVALTSAVLGVNGAVGIGLHELVSPHEKPVEHFLPQDPTQRWRTLLEINFPEDPELLGHALHRRAFGTYSKGFSYSQFITVLNTEKKLETSLDSSDPAENVRRIVDFWDSESLPQMGLIVAWPGALSSSFLGNPELAGAELAALRNEGFRPVIMLEGLWLPQRRADRNPDINFSSFGYSTLHSYVSSDPSNSAEREPAIVHSIEKLADGKMIVAFRFKYSDPRYEMYVEWQLKIDTGVDGADLEIVADQFNSALIQCCIKRADGSLRVIGEGKIDGSFQRHPYFVDVSCVFPEMEYRTFVDNAESDRLLFRIVTKYKTPDQEFERGLAAQANLTSDRLEQWFSQMGMPAVPEVPVKLMSDEVEPTLKLFDAKLAELLGRLEILVIKTAPQNPNFGIPMNIPSIHPHFNRIAEIRAMVEAGKPLVSPTRDIRLSIDYPMDKDGDDSMRRVSRPSFSELSERRSIPSYKPLSIPRVESLPLSRYSELGGKLREKLMLLMQLDQILCQIREHERAFTNPELDGDIVKARDAIFALYETATEIFKQTSTQSVQVHYFEY